MVRQHSWYLSSLFRTALLTPHGEGARKGALKKAHLIYPDWFTAISRDANMRSKKENVENWLLERSYPSR